MSIKNLSNPKTKEWLEVYCKGINADNITVQNFDFTDIKADSGEFKTITAETFNINEYLINDIKAETAEIKTITGTNLHIGQIGSTGVNTVLVGLLDVFGQFNLNGQGGVYNVKEITGLSPTGQWLSLDIIPETAGASNQILARHPDFTANPNAHKKLIWVDPPTGGGDVSNPLTSTLNCNNYNLDNVNIITASSIVLPAINSGIATTGTLLLNSNIININNDAKSTTLNLKGNLEFQTADAGQTSGKISHPTAVSITSNNLKTNGMSANSGGVITVDASMSILLGLTVSRDIFIYNLWGNNISPCTTIYKNTGLGVLVTMDTLNEVVIPLPTNFQGSTNVFNIPNKPFYNLRFNFKLMMTVGGAGNTTIYLNCLTLAGSVRLATFGSFLTQTIANKGFEIDMTLLINKFGTSITAPIGFCSVKRYNNFEQNGSMTMSNALIPASPAVTPFTISIQHSVAQGSGTAQIIMASVIEE